MQIVLEPDKVKKILEEHVKKLIKTDKEVKWSNDYNLYEDLVFEVKE